MRGNDESGAYGDVPRIPKELVMLDARHSMAKAGLFVAASTPLAWLPTIDIVLRIFLTIVGVIAAFYSARYYRAKFRALTEVSDDGD